MNEMAEPAFLPWEDSALLSQESSYAVLSKVSWYLAVTPVVLVRRLSGFLGSERTALQVTESLPKGHAFPRWMGGLSGEDLAPRVRGKSFRDYLEVTWENYLAEVPEDWRFEGLAVCTTCIALGVHLRAHQHAAIVRCPVHDVPLTRSCPHCGAALSDGYASPRAKAFTCKKCRRSLLRRGNIVTRHVSDFAQAVEDMAGGVMSWLQPLHATKAISLGLERHGVSGGRQLFFEAMSLSSEALPPCVASVPERPYLTGLRRVRVGRAPPAACIAKIPPSRLVFESKLASQPYRRDFIRLNAEAYRCALRRVTGNLLLRQTRHGACLGAPAHVWNLLWGPDHTDCANALASCCPVALGFWAWRRSAVSMCAELQRQRYDAIGTPGLMPPSDELQPLLYLIARSHLHYCVYAAHRLVRLPQTTNAARRGFMDAMQSLRTLTLWSADYFPNRYYTKSRDVFVVRFDASRLINEASCSQNSSLQESLLSILGSRNCSLNFPFPLDEPFRPLPDEWVLTPAGMRCHLQGIGSRSYLDASYAEDQRILDRTINWRGSLSAELISTGGNCNGTNAMKD